MNRALEIFIRELMPPAALRLMRRVLGRSTRYEGGFSDWGTAAYASEGYDQKEILEKVRLAIAQVRRGEACFERDSVVFHERDDNWPMLCGLFWAAARTDGRLDVLDLGGSLGSTYFQYRIYLQSLESVRWSVVEQQHFVLQGRADIDEPGLKFYSSIDDAVSGHRPTVILLSSVLQYLEHPYDVIRRLNQTTADVMVIDRTPFSEAPVDVIVKQVVPPAIYRASYPMRIFSMENFLSMLEPQWTCISNYANQEGTASSTTGQHFAFRGLLLERRS